MIRHIEAFNPHDGLINGLQHLRSFGLIQDSRNGNVIVSRTPVITTFSNPLNRALQSKRRDANPFFHVFEAMWMLAGQNDLEFCQRFVKRFKEFSDDGQILHGAYGFRWREFFGQDQLEIIIAELTNSPLSRRAVLSMWDGGNPNAAEDNDSLTGDLAKVMLGGKDVPCNTHIYFSIVEGRLDMTVCNRSNDIVWGLYGANCVHMSFLHEYMAAAIDRPVGQYYHFSNNFHAYENVLGSYQLTDYIDDLLKEQQINVRNTQFQPLFTASGERVRFDYECSEFVRMARSSESAIPTLNFETPFLRYVAIPMFNVWLAAHAKNYSEADVLTGYIDQPDWQNAARIWLQIRKEKANV